MIILSLTVVFWCESLTIRYSVGTAYTIIVHLQPLIN